MLSANIFGRDGISMQLLHAHRDGQCETKGPAPADSGSVPFWKHASLSERVPASVQDRALGHVAADRLGLAAHDGPTPLGAQLAVC